MVLEPFGSLSELSKAHPRLDASFREIRMITTNCYTVTPSLCSYRTESIKHNQRFYTSLGDFKEQRYEHVYEMSQLTAKITYGYTFYEEVLRALIFGWLSKWMKKKSIIRDVDYQPQVNFLTMVKSLGTVTPQPQKPRNRGMVEQMPAVAM
ncbi:hypothetical protein CPB97_003762 [Podila verticillata]|nr:hypothetical protein CPB97_003762 [Podila verticillata]